MGEDLTKKLPSGDDNVASILQKIDSRLSSLEQKVDERLDDTRPIWQKVVADIAQVKEEVHDIKISMREIVWQIGGIAESYVKVQGKDRELEGRIRDLERQQHKPTNSST